MDRRSAKYMRMQKEFRGSPMSKPESYRAIVQWGNKRYVIAKVRMSSNAILTLTVGSVNS